MKQFFLSILFLFASISLVAKDTLVTIKIIDGKQLPVAYAKLTISNRADTAKTLSDFYR